MSTVTVFGLCAWSNPAPGIWEAEATPATVDGAPPFEASIVLEDDGAEQYWRWSLYRQISDDEPSSSLVPVATGSGWTLASAQRQTEQHARTWRDYPQASSSLDGLDLETIVTCSACGDGRTVAELAAKPVCRDPFCASEIFDGHQVADLIEGAQA